MSFRSCKRIAAALAVLFLFSLSGCGVGVIEPSTEAESTTAAYSEAATTLFATTEESTTAAPTQVPSKAPDAAPEQSTAETSTEETAAASTTATKKKKKKTKNQQPAQATPSAAATTVQASQVQEQEPDGDCTITIQCRSVLTHRDRLKEGHEAFVPDDGVILGSTSCRFRGGDTVFTVLENVCGANGIKLNVKSTLYGKYVAGINELDEFDVGKDSGWMYRVNGTPPAVSCSSYTVHDGDSIEFYYTCEK